MGQLSKGQQLEQAKGFGGAVAGASPLGDIYYVDSTNGSNGNDGLSRLHPVATLVYALTLASAGDTIILAPGGSETVTSTIAISTSKVKIVCPTANPESGYTITSAGSLDMMTISGTDVHVEGLKFARSAGAGAAVAGILTTAAADRLVVKNCMFDYTALSSSWSNYGVEITDDLDDILIDGCTFLDCHRGVLFATATGKNCLRPTIRNSNFFVGQATAFGVHCSPTPTGTVAGLIIDNCNFIEADGDGSSATAAWNGSDNTDATRGPILCGANADQGLVTDCRAYSARAQAFNTLNAINAGAAVTMVRCATQTGDDASAAVTSVGTQVSSALSATVSYGVAGSTANSSGLSATVSYGVAGSTAHSSSLSAVVSYGVAGSTANSTSLSAVTSVGTQASSALSATVSYATVGSTADSTSLSATVSYGVVGSTAHSSSLSAVVSYGVAGSTANSSSLSAITSYGLAGSTANSSGLSATVSYGLAGSTANSSGLSATVSYGVAGSTAHSSSLSAVVSYGVAGSTANSTTLSVVQSPGRRVAKASSLADTAIDNNTQSAGCALVTATGDILIEEILLAKDSTGLTGPTNLEVTSNNAYGLTGVNAPHALKAITLLQANENIACTGSDGTPLVPFVLENAKTLYLHGDSAAGTSGGNTRYCVFGTALSAGGSIA